MPGENDKSSAVLQTAVGAVKSRFWLWLVGLVSLPVLFFVVLAFGIIMVAASGVGGAGNPFCGGAIPLFHSPDGATVKGSPITTEQASNAKVIIDTAKAKGLSARDAKIGLMTSIQEASLINNAGGDRDSAGIFQQRPSQGWGTYAQVTNPVYAANTFFDRLVQVENRDQMPLIEVAIAVQRPSRAAYTSSTNNFNDWEAEANALLGGVSTEPASTFCASGAANSLVATTGSFSDPGPGPQNPANGNLVPRASNLRDFIFANWGCDNTNLPTCINEIGGYGVRPAGTPQDHTLGLALDPVIGEGIGIYPDPENRAFGWGLACFLQENGAQLGVQYVIWQGKIWNIDRPNEGDGGGCAGVGVGWRQHGGSGVTQGHYDHLHITVQPGVP